MKPASSSSPYSAALLPAAAALATRMALRATSHAAASHLHTVHKHNSEHSSAMHNRFHEYGSGHGILRGQKLQAAEISVAAVLIAARGVWELLGLQRKRSKSQERGSGSRSLSSQHTPAVWEVVVRIAQVGAFVVASRAGVVRSTAILLLAPLVALTPTPTPRTLLSLLVIGMFCVLQGVSSEDAVGAIALGVLALCSGVLTWAAAPSKLTPSPPSAAVQSALTLAPIILGVVGMLTWTPALKISTVLLALLAPHLPLTASAPGVTLLWIALFQAFAMPPAPPASDFLLLVPAAALAWPSAGATPLSFSFPGSAAALAASTSVAQPWYSPYALLPVSWRPHLSTILRTPASRKIFGFLLLNLAYMGVQMAYGVITNSLGLISDAIHMLFDCLGLAVGLWASVAATWKPDGQYTFGYARVETLSGFANGCFLILISIFIIFEGIQRIMDPPEMETRQLLLVSSIGLAINLFGMWATGGHHHHGHSHGHGHDHGHGDSHAHDSHSHDHGHSHGNGSAALGIVHDKKHDSHVASCSHDHGHDHGHAHEHKHDEKHEHGHEHCDSHDHKHVNDHKHDHEHGHNHSHSHDHSNEHKHDSHSCSDHANPHAAHSHSHDDHSHGHSHSHDDHDHSHDDHDHGHGHHGHSHNMQGVFLHVMADTLGSVGVIVSTILIRWTGWTGWDPLASLFIAALILASVLPLVTDAARVLSLDAKDIEADVRAALTNVKAIPGVESYSAARFWPKGEGLVVGSIHVQLDTSSGSGSGNGHSHSHSHGGHSHNMSLSRVDTAKLVAKIENTLKKRIPGLTEVIVQLESEGFCACMTGSGLGLVSQS